jgi:hypothetical protein
MKHAWAWPRVPALLAPCRESGDLYPVRMFAECNYLRFLDLPSASLVGTDRCATVVFQLRLDGDRLFNKLAQISKLGAHITANDLCLRY